ncbi:hybrid sensor histidine kinase/response regulator [Xanthomonas vesicatoria]|uniref:hybrid sensor histidine kinase/response regulator n=1 Tax=Xanthomonas vesicatoria TaxID=56460 RepID=UPI00073229EC|nr:PAS domain-containing protein [Xanthomonas vesicatoria]KTF36840.1 histidine kinase [Xanthomonas vesicatoria]MCC8560464.1 PAS domain-containing protein [Xanthomonas vesicatoria]MCC8674969.1 PAS domain-containing protein [Xanthomonas vesicatoria]MCC8679774.1 PAS domain-containing protein [Xanthomonas vesicatoria]MCC8683758.1 PAS domain-containing protein [Xanthomonas vesicatoria]
MRTTFPHGDSAMAQAVRAYDWDATPLGPSAQWPSPLRNAIDLLLSSPESMYLVWGEALTFFYNDAYAPILGPRQPHALGAPLRELWADAWEAVRAPIEAAFVGNASRFEEVPIAMNRYGVPEDTWWTFSFSPIYADDGSIGGAFCVTNEVTARMRAQARLADEHERLIRLFEQAPMFMAFLSGPQHRVEFANPCYSRLIGHRDVIGRPLAEALPDALEQGHVRRLDEVYRSGRAYAANALVYDVQAVPGGPTERRLLDLVYQPIAGADGTVSGIFVQGLDITDRISLERAVREAEVRNRQILDSVMDYAIIATDMRGRVTSWNEGARRILGWTEAEMLGQSLERTFTPEDVARRQILIEAAAALESGSGMDERWHMRKSGERFWANGSLMVLREETGVAIGFVKVLRDRTVERLASEALIKSERRLDALVRASSQAIFSATADWSALRLHAGNGLLDDGRPANARWQQEWIHPDDRASLAQSVHAAISDKAALELELRVLDRHQQIRWTLLRAVPLLDADGGIEEWFGTASDVSDRRQAEEQLRLLTETLEERVRERSAALLLAEEKLRQSQKMEAVGQLTGGLAHDFNNLLTSITVGLELLQARVEQGKYDRLERYVEMAQTSAARAAALTQRLLAFSRRQTLAPSAVEVDALIHGMREIISRTLGPSITLQVTPAPQPWKVLVDAPQLENALLNLCLNARDAMPDGGRLTISLHNRSLDSAAAQHLDLPPGDYVCLSVQDTGTGMTEEVMSKVFEPFFTTKPIGQGTGLGLSMIYGFTRQSGGHVRIDSEVGVGTTMALYLPRFTGTHVQQEAAALEQPQHPAVQSCTILLVEDETAIRILISEVLTEAGYRVIEASEGSAAVERLRSLEPIDVLVTDVGLTGALNGRQVADAGRQYRPSLPVLFVTGYAATAAVGAGQLDDGMEVLTKPFLATDLKQRVAQLLQRHVQ